MSGGYHRRDPGMDYRHTAHFGVSSCRPLYGPGCTWRDLTDDVNHRCSLHAVTKATTGHASLFVCDPRPNSGLTPACWSDDDDRAGRPYPSDEQAVGPGDAFRKDS